MRSRVTGDVEGEVRQLGGRGCQEEGRCIDNLGVLTCRRRLLQRVRTASEGGLMDR